MHLICGLAYQLIAVSQDKSLSSHPAGQFGKDNGLSTARGEHGKKARVAFLPGSLHFG
jgi:hypothetical protein